ncbi:hypothetical protein C0J52_18752, partial [Blattella germanica]
AVVSNTAVGENDDLDIPSIGDSSDEEVDLPGEGTIEFSSLSQINNQKLVGQDSLMEFQGVVGVSLEDSSIAFNSSEISVDFAQKQSVRPHVKCVCLERRAYCSGFHPGGLGQKQDIVGLFDGFNGDFCRKKTFSGPRQKQSNGFPGNPIPIDCYSFTLQLSRVLFFSVAVAMIDLCYCCYDRVIYKLFMSFQSGLGKESNAPSNPPPSLDAGYPPDPPVSPFDAG